MSGCPRQAREEFPATGQRAQWTQRALAQGGRTVQTVTLGEELTFRHHVIQEHTRAGLPGLREQEAEQVPDVGDLAPPQDGG